MLATKESIRALLSHNIRPIIKEGKIINEIVDLSTLKELKLIEIDKRTQDLIRQGFIFDGHRFSLSTNAQMNWQALLTSSELQKLDNVARILYPLPVSTMDGGEYLITDSKIMSTFARTAFLMAKKHYDDGRNLRKITLAAESIDKFPIDNRTDLEVK